MKYILFFFNLFGLLQRLEFLGDAVLDLIITTDIYKHHRDIDPGELTDLRSASISNEKFAEAAAKHHLHQYLQHGSGVLLQKIEEYVKHFSSQHDQNFPVSQSILHGPKVSFLFFSYISLPLYCLNSFPPNCVSSRYDLKIHLY